MIEKGLVEIYTGNGKGKTTAAFGLALRAAGRGNKVLVFQFLKPPCKKSGESMALERTGLDVTVERLDVPWNMYKSFEDKKIFSHTRKAIAKQLKRLRLMAASGEYDLLVLDEVVFCESRGLAEAEDIRRLVADRGEHVEIVMTGRGLSEALMDMADLVTEMRELKHPYNEGVGAREGIEY